MLWIDFRKDLCTLYEKIEMCFCFRQFDCPEVFLFVVILNNNHREFVESFQKPKMFYNLKKNIQCTNTHNYTN